MNKGEWKITGFWVSAVARLRLYRAIKHVMVLSCSAVITRKSQIFLDERFIAVKK